MCGCAGSLASDSLLHAPPPASRTFTRSLPATHSQWHSSCDHPSGASDAHSIGSCSSSHAIGHAGLSARTGSLNRCLARCCHCCQSPCWIGSLLSPAFSLHARLSREFRISATMSTLGSRASTRVHNWFHANSSYLTAMGTPSLRASSWTFDHQSWIWPRLINSFVVRLWMINAQYARPHHSVCQVMRRGFSGPNALAQSDWQLARSLLSSLPLTVGEIPTRTAFFACRTKVMISFVAGRLDAASRIAPVHQQCRSMGRHLSRPSWTSSGRSDSLSFSFVFPLCSLVLASFLLVNHSHEVAREDDHILLCYAICSTRAPVDRGSRL